MRFQKKISIVTMHFPTNYGAVLQSYALFSYLQNLGCNVQILNYIPSYFNKKNSLWYIGSDKYKNNLILRLLYYIFVIPMRIRKNNVFSKFRKQELCVSKPYTLDQLMKGQADDSDFYFCGSDQIWSEYNNTIFDPIYFLQFVKDPFKRFSYAASGTINFPLSDRVRESSISWLMNFNMISVREDIIKQNLETVINKKIWHVCDPVFLLDKEQWLSLAVKRNSLLLKEKYILVYAIGDDLTPYLEARKLGDRIHIPVYAIAWKTCPNMDKVIKCSPYDFLSIFANAEYVVTNSFHGVSFSIIFNRQFWVCETSIANHRLLSILRRTGLMDRLIRNGDSINDLFSIDWDCVNALVIEYAKYSKSYITKCLGL